MIVADFSDGWFGGVIMIWVNFGSGQRWASLFYEQLKKSPASPMPPPPLSATDPLLSPLKNLRRQPFDFASLSSLLKKVWFLPTAPTTSAESTEKGICVYSSERFLHARLLKDIYLLSCRYYSPFHYQTPSPFFLLLGEGAWRLGYIPSHPPYLLTQTTRSEKTRAAHLPICMVVTVKLSIFPLNHARRGSLASCYHTLPLISLNNDPHT